MAEDDWLDFFKDKVILDAGCGKGQYIRMICERLADAKYKIIGVDNDTENVRIARDINKEFSNVNIIRADITEMPFKDNTFNIIYSVGVIHYTANPEKTFLRLASSLKDNGKMAIWVYPKKNPFLDKVQIYLRSFTTILPKKFLYGLCFIVVPLLFFFKTHSRKNLLNSSWRECAETIFVFYAPKYLQFNCYENIEGWFKKAGFRYIDKMDTPVSIKGIK